MRNRERWPMYFEIQQQKELGFNKSQVARNLNVSRNTVMKFWNMSIEDYHTFIERLGTRSKKLEYFESEIVEWLRQYPDLSAAQIMDWLTEHHGDLKVAESTTRNYIRSIRSVYGVE